MQCSNSCGIGAISPNFAIIINPIPSAAGTITGTASLCQGQTGIVYFVPAIPNATGYNWTLPAGATIVAGINTNSITVSFSGNATSGNITVQGNNSCGIGTMSGSFAVTINSAPTVNSVVNQTLCNNATTTEITFSGGMAGTTYNWTNDNTAIGLGASGSGNINAFTAMNSGTNASIATITVTPVANGCSTMSANFKITVNSIPVAISNSNSPVCIGSAINLSAQTVSGATYSWTGPNGYSSTAQNSLISSATTANAGNYSLRVSNNSCNSVPATVMIVVNDCRISVDLSVIKTVNNTHPIVGQTIIFTITASNNGNDAATGVTVIDLLEGGYTYVSSSTTTGIYIPATGI